MSARSVLCRRLLTVTAVTCQSLHQWEGTTTLFVTHDRDEATDAADAIAVLLDGAVVQHAPPARLFRQPGSLAVARFLGGAVNAIPGTAQPGRFDCALGSLDVGPDTTHRGTGLLLIRPEAIAVTPGRTGGNVIAATITSITDRGSHLDIQAVSNDTTLRLTTSPSSPVALGADTTLWLPPEHLGVVAAES